MAVYGQNKCVFSCARMLAAALCLWAGAARADAGHGHDAAVETPGPGLVAETQMENPLIARTKSGVMLRLRHSDADGGMPLFWDELTPAHDSRIHLMIVDRTLTDYHHEHPMRTDTEGSYAFFMTPKTSCPYKVWAQVFFKNGKEDVTSFTLPGREECKDAQPDRSVNDEATVDGYHFTLRRDTDGLTRGANTMLTLHVADKDGQSVEELEPVMGAYAHLVGFYDDYETMAHIHPMGEEPAGAHDRGGPDLMFHFRPERAGFVRLFAQVKIGGKMVFVPFGMTVTE